MPILLCELKGCTSQGDQKVALGLYQVYDPDLKMYTTTHALLMCKRCIEFANKCGMEVVDA